MDVYFNDFCTVSNSDSFVVDYTNDDDKYIARRGVEILKIIC